MQGSTLEKGRKQERGKGNDDGREKEKDRKGRDHPPASTVERFLWCCLLFLRSGVDKGWEKYEDNGRGCKKKGVRPGEHLGSDSLADAPVLRDATSSAA